MIDSPKKIQTPQQPMLVMNNIYYIYTIYIPMLDNPNTNAQDNTNTITHNDGDEQYIYLLPILDNNNTNA